MKKRGLKVELFSHHLETYGTDSQMLLLAAGSGIVCVLPGTQILLSDGATKSVEQIKAGDMIISYDPHKQIYVTNTVAKRVEHVDETYQYVRINQQLAITKNHEVWANNTTWKRAEELRICDMLHIYQKGLTKIDSLEVVTEDVKVVYNLELEDEPGNYFAEGVCIHW